MISGVRYLFADSSPQAGRDWLVSQVRFVDWNHASEVFNATTALVVDAHMTATTEELDGADDEPSLAHRVVDRAALFRTIRQHTRQFTFPPVALGLRRTSLGDKMAALMHAMFLDVSLKHLKDLQ